MSDTSSTRIRSESRSKDNLRGFELRSDEKVIENSYRYIIEFYGIYGSLFVFLMIFAYGYLTEFGVIVVILVVIELLYLAALIHLARNTRYIVTDQRVIIHSSGVLSFRSQKKVRMSEIEDVSINPFPLINAGGVKIKTSDSELTLTGAKNPENLKKAIERHRGEGWD